MAAEEYALRRVQWQAFGSLSFRREKMPERHRYSLIFTFLRRVARYSRMHFRELKWAVRAELGEMTGRFHFHVLLAGMPENPLSPQTCSFINRVWTHQLKMGTADCRAWDGRDAVSYILKGEDFSLKGANAYEMGKFAGVRCQVTLSNSLLERRRIP
jgi:hypothetical protein